jgi:N-acetylglucosaminyldiphosphoundecaprenol N-acetyl-beta-D-mannosaminyltransferase
MPSSASAVSRPHFVPLEAEPLRSPSDVAAPSTPRELPIAILGVSFDPMTLTSAVDRIGTMITSRRPHFIVTPNVDFLVQAQHDTELHQILVNADLVLCDGKPLVWASRWLGNALPGRVAGSDLVPMLFERAAERGWKIFLLGGAEGVGAEAARRIAANYPSLPAVEHYSPPLRVLAEMNHDEINARLQAAAPDLVLVCFGCPKQEKWIFQNYRTAGVPVMIGAGGTVDFLAGRLKRAPHWMRRIGLESLFRLGQEPRRLFKRYAGDFFAFLPALAAQLWHRSARSAKMNPEGNVLFSTPMAYGLKVQAAEELHRGGLESAPAFWSHAMDQQGHCVIDLSTVTSIDSTGLAFLAHWQRRLAQVQRNLILYRPSVAVRSALARMHLTEKFVITDGMTAGPPASPAANGGH